MDDILKDQLRAVDGVYLVQVAPAKAAFELAVKPAREAYELACVQADIARYHAIAMATQEYLDREKSK